MGWRGNGHERENESEEGAFERLLKNQENLLRKRLPVIKTMYRKNCE